MMKSRAIITRDSDPSGLIARLTMPPAFYQRVNETRFRQEWVLTPFQHLCLKLGWDGEGDPKHWMMSVFKGPRFQRGMLSGMGNKRVVGVPAGGSVVLTAHSKTSTRFTSGSTTASMEFENDGELWGRVTDSGGDTQYAGEWWSDEPEASIGSSYEVRNLSSGKTGTFTTQAGADDVWVTISSTRIWTVTRSANGSKSCTATFEVGPDGVESADDSAALTITAVMDFL